MRVPWPTIVKLSLTISLSLCLASCRTTNGPEVSEMLWHDTATRINQQYHIQRPLQRILEDIAQDCDNGRNDIALRKLKMLSSRITDSWSTAENLPASYEEEIIKGAKQVPSSKRQADDPFKGAVSEDKD